jgi:RNA polymerase sigma-70 factor, ECF subfamily
VPVFDSSLGGLSSPSESAVAATDRLVSGPTSKRSTEQLVDDLKRAARGERAAFEKIYASTAAKLFGIIIRIVGERDAAENVLRDVYVRVWEYAHEFDAQSGSPITWMATIARNRALDEVKRRTFVRTPDDCPAMAELPATGDALESDHGSEDQRRLIVHLNGLDPEKRRAILRAYFYGMTREEIARETDRPVATIRAWLRRSLAQLKGCLPQ